MENDQDKINPALRFGLGTLAAALASVVVWLFSQRRKTPEPTLPGEALPPEAAIPTAPTAQPQLGAAANASPTPTRTAPAPAPRPPSPAPARSSPPPASPAPATAPSDAPRFTTTTKYLVGVGLFLGLIWLIYFSRSSLSLIIFAALIAFIVNPLVTKFQTRFKMKKIPAVLLTYLVVALVLILIPVLLIPQLVDALNSLASVDWQALAMEVAAHLEVIAAQLNTIPLLGALLAPTLDALAELIAGLGAATQAEQAAMAITVDSLATQIGRTLGVLVDVLGPVVSTIVSLGFMLLLSLQMSIAGDQIQDGLPNAMPPRYRGEFSILLQRFAVIWSSFLRGQLTLMFVIFLLSWILNWLLGTPQALLLAIIAGLLEVIPSLGPFLAWIPAFTLALLFGSTRFTEMNSFVFALLVTAGYGLIQLLENQVLVPRILGEAVNLPPVVVLIGVIIAGSTIGILGVFLATPIMSTGKEIIQYLYNKILESPPPEPPPEEVPGIVARLRSLVKNIPLPRLGRQGKKPAAAARPAGQASEPGVLPPAQGK